MINESTERRFLCPPIKYLPADLAPLPSPPNGVFLARDAPSERITEGREGERGEGRRLIDCSGCEIVT